MQPVYGWGKSEPQQSTAGCRLPIFEPGWQILMARAGDWLD